MQRIRVPTHEALVRVALAILLLVVVGCSGLRRSRPTIDRTADPRIIEEVQARLAAEPSIDASNIRVDAVGAVVMLYGSVAGIGQWQCAIRNAEMVEGVQSVVDFLVLERGPPDVECLAPRDPR